MHRLGQRPRRAGPHGPTRHLLRRITLGNALHPERGLDLTATTLPVTEVIDTVCDRLRAHPILFAVQLYENTTAASSATLLARFDWSTRYDYPLPAAGTNHGIAVDAKNWAR
jgi:hypothetical protein